ncbi:hypothetical protein [Halorussus halophilus]|uniref:hypothetical protein n=1 Tax=Halorussus halophilus TaxID=2650975 RepID=UPI001300F3D5|nr:hypothetical protein [Halorussus halophilus]
MKSWHMLLFFAGVFLLTGAVISGVGAFEYEVKSLGTVETVPDDTKELVAFEYLSDRDQRRVARVIEGERLVYRDPGELPGSRKAKGKIAVERDGETYLITRRVFFNWRTSFGMASIAMALAGLGATFESIRRHHFPNRRLLPARLAR